MSVAALSVVDMAQSVAVALDLGSIPGLVGNAVSKLVRLLTKVVVVGSVVPRPEVVRPSAVAVVFLLLVPKRVRSLFSAVGVAAEANDVADLSRGVLVSLVADASLLLAKVVVVEARH